MPSRPITALIVLFWIGTMGWFGYPEVWPSLFPSDAPPFVIEPAGQVRDGMLHRTGTGDLGPFGGKVDVKLDPIEAPTRSILNPMHPVPKITGLRPGRRWQMPVLNPLGDVVQPAINAILANKGLKEVKLNLFTESKFVNAEVLTETAMIPYEEKEYLC